MIPDDQTIRSTANRIRDHIHRTPVLTCQTLNHLLQAEVFFKCENFQKAGAFKFRGATNGVLSLEESEVHNGVCTHSSGNHAQALSLAARNRGIPAYIVMPETSSRVKTEAVLNYGGKITFCKPTLAAREETLEKIRLQTGAIEIHPYNDYRTIAGQATAALELIQDTEHLSVILAPVGGGGLLSGTALSAYYFSPATKVIAAEPAMADDAFRSFYSGQLIPSTNPTTIADGLLTSLGSLTFPIIRQHVHQIVTVGEESIIKAMRFIWERMKIIIEPSSAVPVAALFDSASKNDGNGFLTPGIRIGVILSGGNTDLSKLPW
ncbi:MAG TPA: pyridoxal-phosphate dependent enzyme [Bacteroidales bacterium]|nr:pyridoxal-phosphate dependent enzyme [Bacteroidales bacterium]HNS45939.1 pyridoxal-phosphate dependent enzyme [Bacteroidales bacterium]